MVVALAVIAAFAVPALLSTRKLDHTAVERTVETQSADSQLSFTRVTDVKCNGGRDMTIRKGATFTCTAANGVRVIITVTSLTGDYTWAVG